MRRTPTLNWVQHSSEPGSFSPGFLIPKLQNIVQEIRERLDHWDDAVAVSKAFTNLQEMVTGSHGIFEVSLSECGSREFSVLVKTWNPITREIEHCVGLSATIANKRYRTAMQVTILATPV